VQHELEENQPITAPVHDWSSRCKVADAANLDLSKRRGASVKNELMKTFNFNASRLESDRLGETKPVVPNDTSASKAMNRRVEFIKMLTDFRYFRLCEQKDWAALA
jgi:hypothetical protein